MNTQTVLIIGASSDPRKYSYKAQAALEEFNQKIILVNPNETMIMGKKVHPSISEITEPIDTVTMYVNPSISALMTEDLINIKPKRVIFNPGAENVELEKALIKAGIKVENACTLVMLRTNQF